MGYAEILTVPERFGLGVVAGMIGCFVAYVCTRRPRCEVCGVLGTKENPVEKFDMGGLDDRLVGGRERQVCDQCSDEIWTDAFAAVMGEVVEGLEKEKE